MTKRVILETENLKFKDEDLLELTALIKKNKDCLNHLELAEENLKGAKEALRENIEEDIPNALEKMGLSAIKTNDGSSITVKQIYRGHISKAKQEEAFEWLRNNKHGDLIKNEVKVSFGMGEDTEANSTKEYLNEKGQSFTDREYVHPQSLNAFIREQTEAGKPLADDLLGVHIGRVATIKKGE